MNMTAHGFTAGPWTATVEIVYPDGWRLPEQMISIGTKETLIALYSTNSMEYPSDEESEANARLIAAAPMMFEALLKAQQFIRNGVELGYIHMPFDPDPATETLPAIEQAISAANGSRG